MQDISPWPPTPETAASLLRNCPAYASTPLSPLPQLAAALGLAEVLVKDEGRRPLGSFKALGGVYAGLRALARASGLPIAALLDPACPRVRLPILVCASDGNHGLAVAAAARLAGTVARVFLPASVSDERATRIAAKGAEVVRVPGTYDDAVRAAADAARPGRALLIADTAAVGDDPVVADVMAGYASGRGRDQGRSSQRSAVRAHPRTCSCRRASAASPRRWPKDCAPSWRLPPAWWWSSRTRRPASRRRSRPGGL